MTEEWRPLSEFPEYAVSNLGRVMRVKGCRGARAGRVLKQRLNRDGYPCVTVQSNNRRSRKSYLVNRLVCEAFNGPAPEGDYHAAHADGDRANNRLENLRWASRAENEADKELHGTRMRGEDHASSKLTEEQVKAIRQDTRPQSAIAREVGVSQSLVCMIRRRRVWAHI